MSGWRFWARTDQFPPNDPYVTWLVMGGRGAGKTRAGAEWIARRVRRGARRLALVGETYEDAREVMIAGPSGLLHIGEPRDRPTYEPSRHRLVWPNGATAHVFSAEDPEGLRGFQFEAAWADEIAKWRKPDAVWSNLQLALRLGDCPQQVCTTTPTPCTFLRALMARETTRITRATTYANKAALADAFIDEVVTAYEGTTLGRQELMGEIVVDRDGALWTWATLEAARIDKAPPLARIVVAVDPPVTSGPGADACGIIVAGSTDETPGRAVVLADLSVRGLAPAAWAARVAEAARFWEADRVVAEVNQGGELVEAMLRLADPDIPYRPVRATRGKTVRAEPVAALYEQGRVAHAGAFGALEDELSSYTGARAERSPDRMDALVWAITDLLLGRRADPSIHLF